MHNALKRREKMNKTGVEYLDYQWNFYPGCKHWENGICPIGEKCWAKSIAMRFDKREKSQRFKPHLIPEKLLDPLKIKKPSRIGVCFTGDLFGDWVDPHGIVHPDAYRPNKYLSEARNWSLDILVKQIITDYPQHTFVFLTKRPENLWKWGKFPDNAWLGATVCNQEMFIDALQALHKLDGNKWISFEPLMESMNGGECEGKRLDCLKEAGINWIVIGGWSVGKTQPEISWVKEIVDAADKAGIPVFLKDNLNGVLPCNETFGEVTGILPDGSDYYGKLRQEFPVIRRLGDNG
jgi:protein gp37